MTASDLLLLVVRANLVAAAAIGLILALRPVMRDRKSTRLNFSHVSESRMPSSA